MENILDNQKFGHSQIRENYLKEKHQVRIRKAKRIDENFLKLIGKRIFDLSISIFTIVFILSWLFPVIAIFIKLDSKGPVFFKQLRHGKGNKLFYCYKFRTMVKNNEADIKQATQDDSRVTKFGKILRMSSLDELPQIFNVLFGDMSIVGPRPHAVPMNIEFSKEIYNFMARHRVKPGITGLAQAKGFRGEICNFQELYSRYRLDFFYVKNWCLIFDVKIIIETAYSLITKKQKAY